MDFEWDEAKRLSNILKHGIDFADAIAMFGSHFIETEDMPTQMGSPLYDGWRSGRDAATVAALREAGAVIVG